MKSLVIGASGLLGEALVRTAPHQNDCVGTSHRQRIEGFMPLDITNADAVSKLLENESFEVVLLCAANPNVDFCEKEPELTRATNVFGVENVAKACAATHTRLVFYSSDYVFDGENGPYSEDARPNPICEYGRQKLEAENIVSRASNRNIVLRITWVYGEERQGKNFVYRVVNTLKNGETLRVPQDQYGNPTLSDDLATATWSLLDKNAQGIMHLAGPDCVNRLEFANLVAETFQQSKVFIQGVTTAELRQAAPRPLRAGLLSNLSARVIGYPLFDAKTGLRQLYETGALNE
jgi:dTDP-4-dehydrorhamnose reductase